MTEILLLITILGAIALIYYIQDLSTSSYLKGYKEGMDTSTRVFERTAQKETLKRIISKI